MGREKTEFAERHQGELLPRRAREYVPPHAVPEQPEARTMENATIKLSPDLDPRMQMTVLAARYVQDDRGPWRGLLVGLAIGSALGALVWFGPWASWFGLAEPSGSASAGQVVGRSWDSLEPAAAGALTAEPTVTISPVMGSTLTGSGVPGAAVEPTVVEEAGEASNDGAHSAAVGTASVGGAASAAARSSAVTRPSKAQSHRAARPAPRTRPHPEPRDDDAPSVDTTAEPTPSGNRVWLAPKERKVWLE